MIILIDHQTMRTMGNFDSTTLLKIINEKSGEKLSNRNDSTVPWLMEKATRQHFYQLKKTKITNSRRNQNCESPVN